MLPAPRHTRPTTSPPVHVVAPHGVPAFANERQIPAPSHRPSAAQVPLPTPQALFGSVSAATFSHVPSEPLPFFAALHAWQLAPHAALQQTPSAQNPLLH